MTDGTWRLAEPGEDYDNPETFMSQGRAWGFRNGYSFRRRTVAEGIAWRFVPREQTKPAEQAEPKRPPFIPLGAYCTCERSDTPHNLADHAESA